MNIEPFKGEISVKEDSPALQKLADTVADVVGVVTQPTRRVLNAGARYVESILDAKADTTKSSIEQRAAQRLQMESIRHQANIESVLGKTPLFLNGTPISEPVSPDWKSQFFAAVREVSDEEMQTLWARVLAGEVMKPGSFSLRTVQFLKTMAKFEAEWFTALCRYCWRDENTTVPYMFPGAVESAKTCWTAKGSPSSALWHMSGIGLFGETQTVSIDSIQGITLSYFDERYRLVGTRTEEEDPDGLKIPYMVDINSMTWLGLELSKVANADKIDGFAEAALKEVTAPPIETDIQRVP